jgi:hypothetical protein
MSSQKEQPEKIKMIGCKVTEEEFQNIITPTMHDCYDLGLIKNDTVSSFVKFCINFWMAHYTNKKQEFAMREKEIEEEKKKLEAIVAEKEVYEKSPARAVEKATDELERLGKELDKGFKEAHPSSSEPPRPQAKTTTKTAVS